MIPPSHASAQSIFQLYSLLKEQLRTHSQKVLLVHRTQVISKGGGMKTICKRNHKRRLNSPHQHTWVYTNHVGICMRQLQPTCIAAGKIEGLGNKMPKIKSLV